MIWKTMHQRILAIRLQSIRTAVLSVTLALAFGTNADDSRVYKILPLGDSITHAEINRASYRYPLWKMLIDAGIEFDFVGSMNTQLDTYSKGIPPQPDYKGKSFDTDHEGHFAWEVNQLVFGRNPNNNTGSGSLAQWAQDYDFDIALVHVGTNDAFYRQSNEQISEEIRALVGALRSDNPNAVILLAKVIPTSRTEADAQAVAAMANMIPGLAEELNSDESPVIVVDMFEEFNAKKLTYDGVHPNEKGEQELAKRWFEAIEQSLPLVK